RMQRLMRCRPLDVEYDVSQSQGTGAKAGNATSRSERLGRRLRAVEQFQPVADRIGKRDQIGNMALISKGATAVCDLNATVVEMRRPRIERIGVGNLPAKKAKALAAIRLDDDPLLAIVHAESQRGA